MNIVMYSNQGYDKTNELNNELKKIISNDSKICCIISNKNTTLDEEKRESFYKNLGFKNVESINVNDYILGNSKKHLDLAKFDVLHIESNDILYFIENWGTLSIKEKVLSHLALGKVVISVGEVSALCSKDAEILKLTHNDDFYKRIKGLDIVDFEVFPYWSNFKEKLPAIIEYSFNKKCTVYCCRDEYGIIIKDDIINIFGETIKVCNGKFSYLNGNVKIY